MASSKGNFLVSIFATAVAMALTPPFALAESTSPPAQSDTDNGGGGDTGAGNGGSGMNEGTNQAGKVKPPPECGVMPPEPSWFPEGPPVNETVVPLTAQVSVHLVGYDTEGHYQSSFMTNNSDDSLVKDSLQTWTHYPDPAKPNPDMTSICMY